MKEQAGAGTPSPQKALLLSSLSACAHVHHIHHHLHGHGHGGDDHNYPLPCLDSRFGPCVGLESAEGKIAILWMQVRNLQGLYM